MNNKNVEREGTTRRIRWIARIWSVPIIAYALLMLSGYVWDYLTLGTPDPYAVDDVQLIEALPPILMFISAISLGLAFRWERIGGWITLGLQLVIVILLFVRNPTFDGFPRTTFPYLLVLVIAFPATLFILDWRQTNRPSV